MAWEHWKIGMPFIFMRCHRLQSNWNMSIVFCLWPITYLDSLILFHSSESFTPYDLWVRAVLDSREGEHSTVVNAQTDVAPPCAPRILNTTCRVAHELAVLWERPVCFNNSLDYYFILYRPMTVSEDKSLEIETSKDVEIQEVLFFLTFFS